MRSASISIKVFGIYVIVTGLTLMIAPNFLLALFGFVPAVEVWVRVLGVLAIVTGYYYWVCGAANARAFFVATITGRIGFFVLCLGLVWFAGAPTMLLAFGVVDVLGAAWTAVALRGEMTGQTAA
jgi:hypothetical protein